MSCDQLSFLNEGGKHPQTTKSKIDTKIDLNCIAFFNVISDVKNNFRLKNLLEL